MGQLLSRFWGSARSGPEEDEATGAAGAYRYPPKNGAPYFASHFIMGGEKFDSPQPESFLFGDNSDLNFLGSKPVSFPYPPPQANEPTKTLKGLINIRKDSVHFVSTSVASRSEDEETRTDGIPGVCSAGSEQEQLAREDNEPHRAYNVEFIFDCDARCAITIYYFCTEEVHSSGTTYVSRRRELTSETFEFKRGANQTFSRSSHLFQPFKCLSELETYAEDPEIFIPMAIHCVALEGEIPRQSHTTLCTIERYVDNSYVLKALKQKLFVDGLCYLLQEIYGLENKVEANNKFSDEDDVDDCGAECVVCMCEMRDTIILPCRHLCLCNACADSLRYQANNCPICRAPFRALLQIRAVQKMGQVTHPALAGGVGDPADPTEQQEGVPAGYQSISLIEALNGPQSVAPVLPPAPVCAQATTSGEKKVTAVAAAGGRKGKHKRGKRSSPAAAASTSRRSDRAVAEEEDAQSSPVTSERKVSVKYVNEVAVGGPSPSRAAAVDSSGDTSVVDLIEEELAKMAEAESLGDYEGDRGDSQDEDESQLQPEKDEEETAAVDDCAVVINLSSSRVSIPGTPTSAVSIRSSQDSSSSSSSSTKLLLSSHPQAPPVVVAAGSAVIVKVLPAKDSLSCGVSAEEDNAC